MPKFNATPVIVGGLVAAGALAGWWLWRRNQSQTGEAPTIEILTPQQGSSFPSGTRIDFSAHAMVGSRDISELIRWSITLPTHQAGFWEEGATTWVQPSYLTTTVLEMEASIMDPVTGQSAKARRSVTVIVPGALAAPRGPAVLRVVPSFRRSDNGWMVKDRHVLEQHWEFARR